MRLVLYVFAVLFIAVWITLLAMKDPGYVLLVRPPWSMELPLTLFVIFLVIGFIAFYISGRLLTHSLRLPRGISLWHKNREGRKARTAMTTGLTYLAAGDWKKAETELTSSLNHSEAPLINYLALALACQGYGDKAKRDDYLAQAHKASPEDSLAIGVTQGLLQYMARQKEQALATLTELHNQAPTHRYVLKLLMETYQDLRDWTGLANLLPELRRQKVLKKTDLEKMELNVHRELLTLSLPSGSPEVLRQAWQAMPKYLHKAPDLIAIYTGKLIDQGENDEAEALLRETLAREWNETLVSLYGRVHSSRNTHQFELAKSWQSTHVDSPGLQLTLGRLALENGATEEAIEYLQHAIKLAPNADAFHELGRAYERLGNTEKAITSYRQGLESRSYQFD